MKKIMFNDKYGLTEAVLNGSKTQTRRVVKIPKSFKGVDVRGFHKYTNKDGDWFTRLYDEDERDIDDSFLPHTYGFGEVVAVAQRYEDVFDKSDLEITQSFYGLSSEGNRNKMFVKAECMPHQIQITNIRLQRLQNITEAECLEEGVWPRAAGPDGKGAALFGYGDGKSQSFHSAREAYSDLIDKISGRGTWDSNPWVFAYTFKLIR